MRKVMLLALAGPMVLAVVGGVHAAVGGSSLVALSAPTCDAGTPPCFSLRSTIAFTSTRDDPAGSPLLTGEIYLVDSDGTNPRRLTHNTAGDAFAALSPDGKRIVFDSNRNRTADEALNTSDLFQMSADGADQTFLTRGSSATWSPDGRVLAFHASASGLGTPIRVDPGSATTDSDIFVVNVDDLLAGIEQPTNITNSPQIDDDPYWSPDGRRIVFTSHDANDDRRLSNTAEVYVLNADGSGTAQRLTDNDEEERSPAWSPDGSRIVFSCRIGGGSATFEICVINADGSGWVRLTGNAVPDLTPTWSPDGSLIVFHRPGLVAGQGLQLFTMAPTLNPDGTLPAATQLTLPPGVNLLASWGELRVHSQPEPTERRE